MWKLHPTYTRPEKEKHKNLTRTALYQTICNNIRNGKHPVAKCACHKKYLFICTYGNISKIVYVTISYQKGYCLYFELGTVMCRKQKTWNKQNLKSDLLYYKLFFFLIWWPWISVPVHKRNYTTHMIPTDRDITAEKG
jgi:hypothetical protein